VNPDRLPTVDDVTPASAWNSERLRGFAVKLPSGNVCFVKRTLDLMILLKSGRIPNPLANEIQKQIDSGSPNLDMQSMEPEPLDQLLQLVDETIAKMVIKPQVMLVPEGENGLTWSPPEGCVSIADFTPEDRFFLFQVAQGGVTDLESFRQQQESLVSHMANVGAVQDKAIEPAGD
jgi:hypothetical protein